MSIKLTVLSLDLDEPTGPRTKVFEKNSVLLGAPAESDLVLSSLDEPESQLQLRLEYQAGNKAPTLYVKNLTSSEHAYVEEISLAEEMEVEVLPNERIILGKYLIKPSLSITTEARSLLASEVERAKKIPEKKTAIFNWDTGIADLVPVGLDGEDLCNIDFVATELFNIRGQILYRGSGLKGAVVEVANIGSITTLEDGLFCFNGIPENFSYLVKVSKPGFVFESFSDSAVLTSDTFLEIETKQLLAIAGTVLRMGEPLSEVEVDAGDLGRFLTDAYGRFLIRDVPEFSSYKLLVEKEGYVFATPGDSGRLDGEPVSVLFTARKLLRIRGRFSQGSEPLSGVNVTLINKSLSKDEGTVAGSLRSKGEKTLVSKGQAVTDSNGFYEFKNLPEGYTYSISAKKKKFRLRPLIRSLK